MQRGQVYRIRSSWAYRYYDTDGKRRQVGGYADRDEAIAALERELRRVRTGAVELTVAELVDEYLAQHEPLVEPGTYRRLVWQLGHATRAFGPTRLHRLTVREIAAWRARLPRGSVNGIHQGLRQALAYAVAIGAAEDNAARKIGNPEPKRPPIRPFESWQEPDMVAEELDPRFAGIPTFACATGLRPEELFALERRDVDRTARVVHVRRVIVRGVVKERPKTEGSRRRVPLSARALEALDASPSRLDSRILFPASRGGHWDLSYWRRQHWDPAVRASGIEPRRRFYDCRHTFASFAIAAGVPLFELARFMGTSVRQIDRTYGHLLPDAEDRVRSLLDVWDAQDGQRQAHLGHTP